MVDEDLHLAADLVAEQLADVIVDRHQLGGGVVGLDAEADDAVVGAVGGVGSLGGWGGGEADGDDAGHQAGPAALANHCCVPPFLRQWAGVLDGLGVGLMTLG